MIELLWEEKPLDCANSLSSEPVPVPVPVEKELNVLPLEITAKVFLYLNLEERKNAKLVCRSWYTFLTSSIFQKDTIVCRGFYGSQTILSRLIDYNCALHNIVFKNVEFEDDSLSFWGRRGCEIRRLCFSKCNVNDQTFVQMMRYCDNLRYLSLEYSQPQKMYSLTDVLSLLIQSKLEYLSLKYYMWTLDDVSRYKNLKNFTVKHLCLKNKDGCVRPENFCFLLSTFRGLNYLELNFGTSSQEVLATVADCQKKLNRLRLRCSLYDEAQEDICLGIQHLSKLEDLKYLDVAFRLTRNCIPEFRPPTLEYLTIRLYDDVYDKQPITMFFNALVRNLRVLKILRIKVETKLRNSIWMSLCSKMKSLQYLRINRKEGYHSSIDECRTSDIRNLFETSPSLCLIRILEEHTTHSQLDEALFSYNRNRNTLFFKRKKWRGGFLVLSDDYS